MKKYNKLLVYVRFFILQLFITKTQAQEYLQVKFSDSKYIPKSEIIGSTVDSIGNPLNIYQLTFDDYDLTQALKEYTVVEFKREFPSVDLLIPNLVLVYKLRIVENASTLKEHLELINSNNIEEIYLTSYPLMLTEVNPNDYLFSSQTGDISYGAASKHLDLINVRKAWEYTRGNPNIKVGLTEANYFKHLDIDNKVVNLNSTSTQIWNANDPLINSVYHHGTNVASLTSPINDNNLGVAGVGNKTRILLFNSGVDGILEAAQNGAKVINCSWGGTRWGDTLGKYEKQIIDFVLNNFNCIIVASAGNGTAYNNHPSDLIFPAAYPPLFSVTSVGCRNPYGLNNGGINWADCYEQKQNDLLHGFPYRTHSNNIFVDLTAPGYDIHVAKNENGFGFDDGTSLAGPLVAASAALLYSLNPNFTRFQIEDYLKRGSKYIYNIGTNMQYVGMLGAGRLDIGQSCKLVVDEDMACMPKINNIVWKDGAGNTIANNDYWQYNTLNFSVSGSNILSNASLEWEFISGNQTVTKTGSNVTLNWGTDFSTNLGPLLRTDKLPLEVYVRQKSGTNSDCVSGFYKESGFSTSVAGGASSQNGPYISNNCDGNVFLTMNTLYACDIKAANIFIGKSLENLPNYTTTIEDDRISVAANNEIRLLPGFHARKPITYNVSWTSAPHYGFFRAFIDGNCNIPPASYNLRTPQSTNNPNLIIQPPIKNPKGIVKATTKTIIPEEMTSDYLFPNPTQNLLNCVFFGAKKETIRVQIITLQGRVVVEMPFQLLQGKNSFQLNTYNLPKGNYIVKYITNGKINTHKIVKL